MTRYLQNAIRVLAVLVVVTLALSFVPQIMDKPLAESAAAQTEEYVKIGWVSTVIKWNPLDVAMVEDYVVYMMVYSSLLMYDHNWEGPVYDLATDIDQTVESDGSMTITITISTNAYFRGLSNIDSTDRKLDARDVAATYNLIKNNTGGAFDWYLLDYSYFTPIQRAGVWDQVQFTCPFTKAIVLDDISAVPILPMRSDEFWANNPNPLGNIQPGQNIGSGPFVFESWERDAWYKYKKAPNYHGATDYGTARTVDIPGVMFVVYGTTATMSLDLNLGKIDAAVLTGDINSFQNVVGGSRAVVNVIKAAVNENGITDIAINAIPDAFDTGGYLTRHEALEDPFVRKAIMMTLDKDYIVNDMLYGLPVRAASVVQPGFWQADIEELPFDPEGAKEMMLENGWIINSKGWLEATASAYGVQEEWFPAGTSLTNIRCQAIDTDNNYIKIAMAWPGWAEEAGIQLIGTQESENTMVNEAWYKANYDIWVWHWGWGPEPIGGALTCWLTSEIEKAGDNCQMPMGPWWAHKGNYTDCDFISQDMIDYYDISNPETWDGDFSAFDQNITDAMRILDVDERKVILDKLQQWIYDSYCENPPYYDLGLYAFTDYRFDNWGNWRDHSGLNCQAGLPWLWYALKPVVNRAPLFDDPPLEDYTAYVGMAKRFNVTVHDFEGDKLWVNFSFGDGSADYTRLLETGTTSPTNVETTHTYTAPGEFMFNVSVTDMFEGRYVYRDAPVVVLGDPNEPAELTQFTPDIPSPAYIEEVITWTATAVDPDSGTKGTGFKFTWDWGDGTYTVDIKASVDDNEPVTSVKSHSWDIPDTYTVTVNVWDYPEGQTNEIGEHNASASRQYTIVANQPPSDPEVQDIQGPPGVELSCVASTTDPDMETLRFTWEWDDGTYTVQEITQEYAGQRVTSEVWHSWDDEGTFPVIVYVEDLGQGHNVSTEVEAVIDASINVAPGSIILVYSPDPAAYDVELTFNVSAVDPNGDGITFRVDFGDDSDEETETTEGGVTTRQYVEFTHTYDEEGTYVVTVNATDDNEGGALSREVTFNVVVLGNEPPELIIQTTYSAKFSIERTIQPLSVTDPDDDDLTVWYSWGDGAVSMGDPDSTYAGKHTYMQVGKFLLQVSASDGIHNVSKFANVTVTEINEKPALENIVVSPSKDVYSKGETITFTVTVSDLEGDNVTVTIDFGDGESDEQILDLEAKVETDVAFTHAYDDDGDFTVVASVDDGQLHSVPAPDSRSVTITVGKSAFPWGLAAVAVLAIIVALVAVAVLMKRKKGGKAPTELSGMEGMSVAPEEPPPQP